MTTDAMMTTNTVGGTIVATAKRLGVNPILALAQAWTESRMNPFAKGDFALPSQISTGPYFPESQAPPGAVPTSFGLYQLHDNVFTDNYQQGVSGGELGTLTTSQAENATTNADTALSELAAVSAQYPNASPGQIAALAGKPADPQAYAATINATYNQIAAGNYPAGFAAAYNQSVAGSSASPNVTALLTSNSGNGGAQSRAAATAHKLGLYWPSGSNTKNSNTLNPSNPGFLHTMQDVLNMHAVDTGWLGALNIPADIANLGITIIARLAVVGLGATMVFFGFAILSKGAVKQILQLSPTNSAAGALSDAGAVPELGAVA